MTPVVKALIIVCVAVWLVLQVIVEKYFLSDAYVTFGLGLVPDAVFSRWHLWQPFTYQFLHSYNVFHIVFNMLLLWWLGSELEARWGSRLFLSYYLVSGIGAGLIYLVGIGLFGWVTESFRGWTTPVVGASGAVFGLMLAYGILFGERIIYFMMVFPMRAKWFVLILAAVEVATLLNSGIAGGEVANLAHLGGLVSGFLFLRTYAWVRSKGGFSFGKGVKGTGRGRRGPSLKLVVDNRGQTQAGSDKADGPGGKDPDDDGSPKYWN